MSSSDGDISQRPPNDTSFDSESIGQQPGLAKDSEGLSAGQVGPAVHNVTISLAGNYSISISRKGNTKLSFDKNSLAGTLALDGSSKSETRLPLAIKKFRVSKNLKKINYQASIQSEHLQGKVSGRLRFQNPIDIANPADQTLLPTQKSALKITVRAPRVIAKKGSLGKMAFDQTGQATLT